MAHDTSHGGSWKRLGDGTLTAQDFEEGLGHILPLSVLRNVLFILLFLTAVTVWASQIDFGTWNIVIAIVIASIKAGIVGTYFMHLKFERNTILMYVLYPIVILAILIGGCVIDTVTKSDNHVLPFGVQKDDYHIVIRGAHDAAGHEAGHSERAEPSEHVH